MDVIIRDVRKDDIVSVADIKVKGWQSAYRGMISDDYLDNMDMDKYASKMYKSYNSNGFIVAVVNDSVVGFCRYIFDCDSPYLGELSALYVRPDLKGNGIGTMLFNYVVNEFKKCGKTKMILWCLKDNYKSRKFYSDKGGVVISEKAFYLDDILYTDVCFSFDLEGGNYEYN